MYYLPLHNAVLQLNHYKSCRVYVIIVFSYSTKPINNIRFYSLLEHYDLYPQLYFIPPSINISLRDREHQSGLKSCTCAERVCIFLSRRQFTARPIKSIPSDGMVAMPSCHPPYKMMDTHKCES